MRRQLYILIILLAAAFGASAQDVQPTPAPSVKANPSPTVTPATPVQDAQQVTPDNLQGVPQIAPNYRSEDRSLPDLGRVGVDMAAQYPLALREAIALALDNNKDIEVTRENVKIAEFDLKGARGVYEPRFSGVTYFERVRTPVFSFFGGGSDGSLTQSNFAGNVDLQGLVKSGGGTYGVHFDDTRNTTNNLFSLFNPIYTTNLRFSYTQPILRGRSFDQNRRTIEIAKRNLSLTDSQFRQRTIEVISNVQRAYWDLAYALRNLQVQRDSVRDARNQLEHNKRMVDEGQLAPIDVVAAETQVANFEQAVYEALNTVSLSENNLKNLISQNRNDAIWAKALTPVDPVELDAPRTSLPEALDLALQNRPELEINQTQKDINALDQRYFKEQTKPQIDLVTSYTLTGAAGTLNASVSNPFSATNTTNAIIDRVNLISGQTNPILPPLPNVIPPTVNPNNDLIGGNPQAFANLIGNKYPTFRVGVQFNLPLFGDKTAKAQLGRSTVEGQRLQTQREQLEQNIQVDVRNALQVLRTAEARLRAAAISRENTAKQYESEQRKLDAGQSDVYRVLERQTALSVARSSELRSQTELNKAIADLQRATGNSLKENNVQTRLIKPQTTASVRQSSGQ